MAPPLLATTPIRAQISPALLADASIFANLDDRIASLLRCRKSRELKASSSQNFVFCSLFLHRYMGFQVVAMAALVLVVLEVVV